MTGKLKQVYHWTLELRVLKPGLVRVDTDYYGALQEGSQVLANARALVAESGYVLEADGPESWGVSPLSYSQPRTFWFRVARTDTR
jgi:hypothetical protein